MYRKDQIKGILALILFGAIGLTYFLSKDKDISLTVSVIAFGIWLIVLYLLKRREKQ